MDKNLHSYEKPETKKHDAINTVQGSYGYGSSNLYYTTLYYVYYYSTLYYYY